MHDPRVLPNDLPAPVDDGAATLVIDDGVITHVFYPVFPPDKSAVEVVGLLAASR